MVALEPAANPLGQRGLALGLGQDWEVKIAEQRTRAATSPDGEPVTLEDGVILLRRSAG